MSVVVVAEDAFLLWYPSTHLKLFILQIPRAVSPKDGARAIFSPHFALAGRKKRH
jgi:hypothetical protein